MGPDPAGPVSPDAEGKSGRCTTHKGSGDDGVAEVSLRGFPRGCLLPDRWARARPCCPHRPLLCCPHPLTPTAAWKPPLEREVLSQWLGEGDANTGPGLGRGGWGGCCVWSGGGCCSLKTEEPPESLCWKCPEAVPTFPLQGPALPLAQVGTLPRPPGSRVEHGASQETKGLPRAEGLEMG